MAAATKSKKSKSKDVEIEVVEDDDVELEDLDADVEDEEPKAKGKKAKGSSNGAQEVTFGVADLAKHLSKKLGKEITTRELRAQIRRMAREDTPRVNREIVPGNRTRYDWPKGLKDPEVVAIIKAVTGGEMDAAKKEKLDELKKNKAAKQAAKAKKNKAKGGKNKKEAEVEEVDVDEDDD